MRKAITSLFLALAITAGAQNNPEIQKFIDMNNMSLDELLRKNDNYKFKSKIFKEIYGGDYKVSDDGGIRTFHQPKNTVLGLLSYLEAGGSNTVLQNDNIHGYSYNPGGLGGDSDKFVQIIINHYSKNSKDGFRKNFVAITFITHNMPLRDSNYE